MDTFRGIDYSPLAIQVTEEILPTSTRARIPSLPQSIDSETHLSVYNDILSQATLSSNISNLSSELADLMLVYDFMVAISVTG